MFSHGLSIGNPKLKKEWPFVWKSSSTPDQLTVYTDTSLIYAQSKYADNNIAWMLESKEITPLEYSWVLKNSNKFSSIFTFDKDLLEALPQAKFVPLGGCWIDESDRQIHNKTKNISLIASKKKTTTGQKLRHQIVRQYQGSIDGLYGGAYLPVEKKLQALKNYRYSIVIENTYKDYYFSEKLIDCLVTGTIPIYWGCPSVEEFFDKKGFIRFTNIRDLDEIFLKIGEEDYLSRIDSILKNFEIAKQYTDPELNFWRTLSKNFFENKC